jgi:acyl-CoA synthetase (AMP-forming)/AMP-acid ligase II
MSLKIPGIVTAAGRSSIGSLFHSITDANPTNTAVIDGKRSFSYTELEMRSNRVANYLLDQGVNNEDRICILAHNSAEYVEIILGAAKAGVIVSVLNWRLGDRELQHCFSLVDPRMIFVDSGLIENLDRLETKSIKRIVIDGDYDACMTKASPSYPDLDIDPETGLLVIYTSGTTGLPKGALVSHRALIARGLCFRSTMKSPLRDNFIAWTPMYHMVATDQMLAILLGGGTVYSIDGYQPDEMIEIIETVKMSWLVMVPGMVGEFVSAMKKKKIIPKGVGHTGAMADLIPRQEIAGASEYLCAPFYNTFGATETGICPASAGFIPIGEGPERLSKEQNPYCDLRLVDADDNEVPVGTPGEVSIAGPTVFSGYWNNEEANMKDFRGGRFHSGDLLRRNMDGTLEYVDRVKFMIKSGGENIYPAEIELILLTDPRIESAVVVRKQHDKWGEVPVLYVVRHDQSISARDIMELCKKELSSFKQPKEIRFIKDEDIPRSTTGKIQRHILEDKLHSIKPEVL